VETMMIPRTDRKPAFSIRTGFLVLTRDGLTQCLAARGWSAQNKRNLLTPPLNR